MFRFKEPVMEICANCLKETSTANPFCPHCGYPNRNIGIKRCARGHTIFETYKNCPFCGQMVSPGNSATDEGTKENSPVRTELLENAAPHTNPHVTRVKMTPKTELLDDKTVLETDSGRGTFLEREPDDRTRFETMTGFPDKTVMEDDVDKTVMDEGKEELPRFFAWLVFIDEEGKPLQDLRLTRQKSVIGKGSDADIPVGDDFASKLHAVVYLEEGQFFLSDLGSTNHTWLNEKKIMNEALKDGDHLRIGHQNMIFKRVRISL
jgi:RNA polymerase subunit RPABC4/transcription elongation factor Spt4